MQFQALVLAAFASLAAAQTTATVSSPTLPVPSLSTTLPVPSATSTASLVALVQGLPQCGVKCLSEAAKSANCDAADLKCICSNAGGLTSNTGLLTCVTGNCDPADITKLTTDAPQVCDKLNNNPSPAEVSSASSIVSQALATASVSNSRSQGAAAARRTDAPALAVMGGAAAAFAAYAL